MKCLPSIHIWDWDTHSTSLLTPLHQIYPQAVHPSQKLPSHHPPVISLFPQPLPVIHVVLLIVLVFSYLSCVLSSSTFLSLCISYIERFSLDAVPMSHYLSVQFHSNCKGKVSGKIPILDTFSERRPCNFKFKLYARHWLNFSAQILVLRHGDCCEVGSCAGTILVARRLLWCFRSLANCIFCKIIKGKHILAGIHTGPPI